MMVSPCSFCKAGCCNNLLITITSFDLIRIMEHSGLKPQEFVELAPPAILNFDQDTVLECYTSIKDKRGKRSPKVRHDFLLALKSRPCVFLNNTRCLIHPVAPLTCRSYPHLSGGKITRNALCPIASKALFHLIGSRVPREEFQRELNRYKHLVLEWNRKHGGKRECVPFLIEESRKFLANK